MSWERLTRVGSVLWVIRIAPRGSPREPCARWSLQRREGPPRASAAQGRLPLRPLQCLPGREERERTLCAQSLSLGWAAALVRPEVQRWALPGVGAAGPWAVPGRRQQSVNPTAHSRSDTVNWLEEGQQGILVASQRDRREQLGPRFGSRPPCSTREGFLEELEAGELFESITSEERRGHHCPPAWLGWTGTSCLWGSTGVRIRPGWEGPRGTMLGRVGRLTPNLSPHLPLSSPCPWAALAALPWALPRAPLFRGPWGSVAEDLVLSRSLGVPRLCCPGEQGVLQGILGSQRLRGCSVLPWCPAGDVVCRRSRGVHCVVSMSSVPDCGTRGGGWRPRRGQDRQDPRGRVPRTDRHTSSNDGQSLSAHCRPSWAFVCAKPVTT